MGQIIYSRGEQVAASPRVRLFSPIQIWAGFLVALLLLAGGGAVGIWGLAESEATRLAGLQADLLLRARLDDLKRGDFRSAIEGTGESFRNLHVVIKDGLQKFSFGEVSSPSGCATRTVDLAPSPRGALSLTICHDVQVPLLGFGALVLGFLAASIVALRVTLRLEKRSFEALSTFLIQQGVEAIPQKGLAGVLDRITEIVQQLEVARAQRRSQERAAVISEIAVAVSHDIRAPLAAFSRVMSKADIKPDGDARLARNALRRINEIVADLDESTKLGPEHSKAVLTRDAINAILTDAVEEARQVAPRVKIACVGGAAARNEASERILADPSGLRRVLANLLHNSADACIEHGSVHAEIFDAPNELRIEIRDSGVGIPAEMLANIGRKGFTFGKAKGSGLGLYLSKQAVRSWGGELVVSSTERVGTCVAVVLTKESSAARRVDQH